MFVLAGIEGICTYNFPRLSTYITRGNKISKVKNKKNSKWKQQTIYVT